MARATSSTMVSGRQLFSYVECNDWSNGANRSTFTFVGGVTSGFEWDIDCTSTLKYWENGVGHDLASGSGRYYGYNDMQLANSGGYFDRQVADRLITLECYSSCSLGNGSATLTFTVPRTAGTITGLSATRVSDNQVNLSWTNPSTIDGVGVEVSIDGGSWSQVTFLGVATSYQYTQASADHSYRFRVWAAYKSNIGTASNVVTVDMSPSAPQSISVAASGGTNVTVTLTNNSPVATSLEYQTSTDGGSTWSASTTVSGSPVTSFSTSVSGTALIRVRNKNATGVSAWLVSDPITTICPPAPPTLRTPSGSVYDMALGDIEFSWLHNSLDGSSQTAYQLRYARNGGAWTTLSGTTAQSRTVSLGTFTAGDSVTWQVRTKGADANYSDWSPSGVFNVYTAPTLSITSPGATVTGMPISLTATYSDMAGFTCQAAAVSLTKDGRTLYSEAATINGTSITSSLDVSEFLPTNGETYTVVLTARSSSGLSTSANATFTVDFVEPQAGDLNISNDPDTGYVSLLATFDNSASEITYTGSTNEQFESTEGYVRSLYVDGKSEAHNSPNLYDPSKSVSGYLVAGGSVQPAGSVTNERTSDFIPVIAGKTYVFQVWATPPKSASQYLWMAYILYDSDKSAVGQRPSKTAGADTGTLQHASFIIEIPSGISYIRLSARMYDDGRMMLEQGETESDYQPFPHIVSIEGVSVKGRNLLPKLTAGTYTNNGVTIVVDDDGVATMSGTTTASGNAVIIPFESPFVVTDGLYLQMNNSVANASAAPSFESNSAVSAFAPAFASTNLIFTVPSSAVGKTIERIRLWLSAGVTLSGTFAPMLSTSSTATAYEPYSLTTITTPLRSAGSVHDTLTADADSWTVERKVGTRAYQAGDESDPDVLTDGTNTYYALTTPTTDTPTSMSTIEIGSAFTVATDLDSTFSMTTWDGSADAVSVSVSRVNADGTVTPLLTDGQSGAGIVDKYAPLNTDYQYAITTKAVSQAVKTVYVDNEIVTDLWFAYWGENIASAKWNPDNGGIQIARPQKTRVYYAGRKDPVSYDGAAVSMTETPSWMIVERSEIQPFVQLIEDGGRGVYKSCDGWVYHADFDLTLTPKYIAIGYCGGIGLTVTRIAGDRL